MTIEELIRLKEDRLDQQYRDQEKLDLEEAMMRSSLMDTSNSPIKFLRKSRASTAALNQRNNKV